MKLTSVEIHPSNSSEYAELNFRDPTRENPYNVKAIVGLDASEIIPRYYGTSVSMTKFYDLSLMKRDIVLRIELSPRFGQNESYSDLRDDLYRMIASSRTGKIELLFKNEDEILAAISGFVSKFEAAHFERVQEVQLTIKCDEPMLKALTPVTVGITGLAPRDTIIQDNRSNAPHGFKFDMALTSNLYSIKVVDPDDSTWSFEIVPINFLNGDVLHYSNVYNDKYLYLTRGATTIYLADRISSYSVWPFIFPGNNRFAFTTRATVGAAYIPATALVWNAISYYPTYWGV